VAIERKQVNCHPLVELMDDYLVELGSSLRRIRKQRKMTQLQVSIDSGVPLSSVAAIEQGKLNASTITLKKIANSLGAKMSELYSFD
jgi:transcriptional regulator with XRE-family HTH domain